MKQRFSVGVPSYGVLNTLGYSDNLLGVLEQYNKINFLHINVLKQGIE